MQQQKIFSKTLWILLAINILNFYDRQVVGSLTEPLRRDFNLSDTQIGLLSSAFTWLYAIVGLPLGRVADTWNPKPGLAMTLIQGAGVVSPALRIVTYSRPFLSKPPSPLKNSRPVCTDDCEVGVAGSPGLRRRSGNGHGFDGGNLAN